MNFRRSITFKWPFYQFMGALIILVAVLLIEYSSIRRNFYHEVEISGLSMVELLVDDIFQNHQHFSADILDPLLDQYQASIPDIYRVSIIDRSNQTIVDTNPLIAGKFNDQADLQKALEDLETDVAIEYIPLDGKKYLHVFKPLLGAYQPQIKSNIIGIISVYMSLDRADRLIRETLLQTISILSAVFVFILLVQILLIRQTLLRPILEIIQATRKFGSGNFSIRTKAMSADELGEVALTFNQMADEVERVTQTLQVDIQQHEKDECAIRETNARLNLFVKELEQRNKESMLLTEMGNMLQISATSEESYDIIQSYGLQLFPGLSGKLYIFSASRNDMEQFATWGDFQDEQRSEVIIPAECWAVRRGQIHVGGDGVNAIPCKHMGRQPSNRYVCLPLMAHGETLGVLHLCLHDPNIDLTEIKRLSPIVAEHISLSLANIRLRETLRNQSIRDVLTSLFNRRYFEETFERELIRAERYRRPLSIIMIDVDRFKSFNDQYGHQGGDIVLREIGSTLIQWIRGGDVACRYGGEEFVLLMPEISLDTTLQRAEKLRCAIENLTLKYHEHLLGPVTISMGVAVYPLHGTSTDELLRKADLALYQAKSQGRNRVIVSSTEASE